MSEAIIGRIVAETNDKVVSHKYICAIDFGSAATGYAFNERGGTDKTITLSDFGDGQCKTETAVALDRRGEVKWFGSTATNKYAGLGDEAKNYMYFSRFKMRLFTGTQESIGLDLKVEASDGRKMQAFKVIAAIFKYLRGHFFDKVRNATGLSLRTNQVLWVLTVPAIWDNAAKQLMRHAAQQAEFCNDEEPQRLRFVHEPEAAGIFCTNLDISRFVGDKECTSHSRVQPGERVLVVDCGGGTVDISVLEKERGDSFKISVAPSGGPWGGNVVSDAVWDLMVQAVGKIVAESWRHEDSEGYVELRAVIENKKHAWDGSEESSLVFNVPASFKDFLSDMEIDFSKEIEKLGRKLREELSFRRGRLTVGAGLIKTFFSESHGPICEHLSGMKRDRKLQGVKLAFIVGGFANSNVLQRAVKQQIKYLAREVTVLVPIDATSSILKGAVQMTSLWIRGKNPISARVSERTYGIVYATPYDEDKHKSRETFLDRGEKCCDNLFKTFVRVGDEVPTGHTHRHTLTYNEDNIRSGFATNEVYSSIHKNVEYIDDPGCKLEATIKSSVPPQYTVSDEPRSTTVMIFGDAEIKVVVIDDGTGESNDTTINFLSKYQE